MDHPMILWNFGQKFLVWRHLADDLSPSVQATREAFSRNEEFQHNFLASLAKLNQLTEQLRPYSTALLPMGSRDESEERDQDATSNDGSMNTRGGEQDGEEGDKSADEQESLDPSEQENNEEEESGDNAEEWNEDAVNKDDSSLNSAAGGSTAADCGIQGGGRDESRQGHENNGQTETGTLYFHYNELYGRTISL